MFGKKKKELWTYTHPQLGEVRYDGRAWVPSFTIKLELWGKSYDLPLQFMTKDVNEHTTPAQMEAFERVKSIIKGQRDEIEKMVYCPNENKMALSDRILPYTIDFSRKGECAISYRDLLQEQEEGIIFEDEPFYASYSIFLLPMMISTDAEPCWDCMHGFDEFSSIVEVYGTEEQQLEYFGC